VSKDQVNANSFMHSKDRIYKFQTNIMSQRAFNTASKFNILKPYFPVNFSFLSGKQDIYH